jgi:DNA-directed RNA polymerase I, II, and III subunit RPABC1
MSVVPQLFPLETNSEKNKKNILTTIIKMLINRKLLDENKMDTYINSLLNQHSIDNIYKIKLDYPEVCYGKLSEPYYYIKFLNQKLSGISKTSIIGDFLYEKQNIPKLIIIPNSSSNLNTLNSQIKKEFPNSEIFLEAELMMNLVDHDVVPKHELLSDDEKKMVLHEYLTKNRQLPKIQVNDAVSRYFNAKIGNIFRIIRPSEVSGLSVTYRLVIDSNKDEN